MPASSQAELRIDVSSRLRPASASRVPSLLTRSRRPASPVVSCVSVSWVDRDLVFQRLPASSQAELRIDVSSHLRPAPASRVPSLLTRSRRPASPVVSCVSVSWVDRDLVFQRLPRSSQAELRYAALSAP